MAKNKANSSKVRCRLSISDERAERRAEKAERNALAEKVAVFALETLDDGSPQAPTQLARICQIFDLDPAVIRKKFGKLRGAA